MPGHDEVSMKDLMVPIGQGRGGEFLSLIKALREATSEDERNWIMARMARLVGDGGAGAERVEFPSERGLREEEAALLRWRREEGEPLKLYLDRLDTAIKLGNLKRAEANDLWGAEIDRAKLAQQAPLLAAQTLQAGGGGFVPAKAERMPGIFGPPQRTEPQPFQPFVEAFRPALPEPSSVMGGVELPNLMQMLELAKAAGAASSS